MTRHSKFYLQRLPAVGEHTMSPPQVIVPFLQSNSAVPTMCDHSQLLLLSLSVSEIGLHVFTQRFDFLTFLISQVL